MSLRINMTPNWGAKVFGVQFSDCHLGFKWVGDRPWLPSAFSSTLILHVPPVSVTRRVTPSHIWGAAVVLPSPFRLPPGIPGGIPGNSGDTGIPGTQYSLW